MTDTLDELATVQTSLGPMEKWKARALSIGWMQRKIDAARAIGAPMCAIAYAAASHDDQPQIAGADPQDQAPPAGGKSAIAAASACDG
jgi:hypothetical protein